MRGVVLGFTGREILRAMIGKGMREGFLGAAFALILGSTTSFSYKLEPVSRILLVAGGRLQWERFFLALSMGCSERWRSRLPREESDCSR